MVITSLYANICYTLDIDMAKPTGPLLSMQARGMLGERLTFSVRDSGQQVRFQRSQKDKITAPRSGARSAYTSKYIAWNLLDDSAKQVFIDRAKNLHMTGYNLFMREFVVAVSWDLGVMFLGDNFLGVTS